MKIRYYVSLNELRPIFTILFICIYTSVLGGVGNRVYEVWDDRPAPNRGNDYSIIKARGYPYDKDWEMESYPIGNGYMGANIFGRTDTERIQITEKTLTNEGLYGLGGLTSFAEIYLEFDHYNPVNYKRSLNLNEGILYVDYEYEGVRYSREYLANYPENVIAIKLSSNKRNKVSFTLSAEIPYLRSIKQINTRTGSVIAESDLITLSGNIAHFNMNYEGQIKVLNDGGQLFAENENGTPEIRVANANAVVLLIAAGTNYELSEDVFLEEVANKKLDVKKFPHEKVSEIIAKASGLGFRELRHNHLQDFKELFSRVELVLTSDIPNGTTKDILDKYRAAPTNPYLEELLFHFGRYLLISSSRKGTLPTGLQGVWSQYEVTPWSGGYWHNINVQMNYWGAFSTNIAETFLPYMEYFEAYLPLARKNATRYVEKYNPDKLDEEGDNGWSIGTGASAFHIHSPGGHSGPGTGGFTTKLFWDYYDFTRDTSYLRNVGYPALLGMSKFLSKSLHQDNNGIYLIEPSASPEQREDGEFYRTKGTTFDQGFTWETYNDLLKAAQVIDAKDDFLEIVRSQIDHLDPILIGSSGQVKEYREEDAYGEIGEKHHRHVSQLCALYPGTLINSQTQEWLDGVSVALDLRGNNTTGWGMAHRMNLRARTREAEEAHEVYSLFIKERACPNLWTLHPPFQIDGNLGTMAGVAEMLLQSHEGYIEPLPALPKAWSSGKFSGLVARGNFEVAAEWDNGQASAFQIKANAGGECQVRFPGIGSAIIRNESGDTISTTEKDANNICFVTEPGGVYHINLELQDSDD